MRRWPLSSLPNLSLNQDDALREAETSILFRATRKVGLEETLSAKTKIKWVLSCHFPVLLFREVLTASWRCMYFYGPIGTPKLTYSPISIWHVFQCCFKLLVMRPQPFRGAKE